MSPPKSQLSYKPIHSTVGSSEGVASAVLFMQQVLIKGGMMSVLPARLLS